MHSLSDYDYILPQNLIAQNLAQPPDHCKLLIYDRKHGIITNSIFHEITNQFENKSVLVFNDSKVIKARLPIFWEDADSANHDNESISRSKPGEIFFLKLIDNYTFEALVRPGKKFKVGSVINFNDSGVTFTVKKITQDGRILQCSHPILELLEQYGEMPLPPYISYEKEKSSSYQPITATNPGSVAAPTATLHFTPKILSSLQSQGVNTVTCTLHVGLGTFKQVDTEEIKEYDIHSEIVHIDHSLFGLLANTKIQGKNITGVGTTVTRSLESMPYLWKLFSKEQKEQFDGDTIQWRENCVANISMIQASKFIPNFSFGDSDCMITCKLFIYPGDESSQGFTFRIIDQLITNFHLPKSSLLMLVAAFIGFDNMKKIYNHAIENNYMFYSFGDAMLLKNN